MLRRAVAVAFVCAVLTAAASLSPAAPPGPADLMRSIDTARKAITDNEKILTAYGNELRGLTNNDPASAWRREEIRILRQHYVHENETLRTRINDDYKKIQDYKARGIQ